MNPALKEFMFKKGWGKNSEEEGIILKPDGKKFNKSCGLFKEEKSPITATKVRNVRNTFRRTAV